MVRDLPMISSPLEVPESHFCKVPSQLDCIHFILFTKLPSTSALTLSLTDAILTFWDYKLATADAVTIMWGKHQRKAD